MIIFQEKNADLLVNFNDMTPFQTVTDDFSSLFSFLASAR